MSANSNAGAIDRLIFLRVTGAGFSPLVAANVVAQARLETADYTSNVFRQNNNLFGYKFVGQRGASSGSPVPGSERSTGPATYARYNDLAASVDELIGWIHRRVSERQFTLSELETPDGYAAGFGRAPRRFYGVSVAQYAAGLKSKLRAVSGSLATAQRPGSMAAGLDGWALLLLAAVAFYMVTGRPASRN